MESEVTSAEQIGQPRIAHVMLFFLRTFGLWHPHRNWAYAIYSYLLHLTFTLLYVLSLIVALFRLETNSELISASAMTLTLIALNIKVLNLYRNNSLIRQCLATIAEFRLHPGSQPERTILRRGVGLFTTVATTLYVTGNTAGCSQYAAAYVAGETPFAAWYPAASSVHWSTWYWYQVVGMLMLSNLNMTMELFPSYLMNMCSVQLGILGERMRNLGAGVAPLAGDFEAAAGAADQRRAREALSECIRTHQAILRCIEGVQKGFTVGFFAQITASAAIVCAMAVQLTFNSPKDDGVAYAYYLTFFASIVAQCCLPCYFGHELITRSEQLINAAYDAAWTQMSRPFRRMLIVFLERAKRSSVIRAGKLFPLSLDTFSTIMSFTYKLYALVANVN